MANQMFCGAVASQAYRWGYTCEYCKQPVEKKNYISTKVGSMHKSTTWVTITADGAKAMEERARMQLAGAVAQMQAKLDAGQFDVPEKEDGKCPHCRKYQHWSSAIRNQIAAHSNPKKGRGDPVDIGCSTLLFGQCPGLVLMLLADKLFQPGEDERTYYMIGSLVLGFTLTLLVVRTIFKKSESKLDAQVKELEGLEKNEPRFIAWEELNSGLRGISIR